MTPKHDGGTGSDRKTTGAQDEIMDQNPDIDAPVGDYVYEPPYLEMRLRMLLTGSASPSDRTWAKALTRLLDHLGSHPVPDEEGHGDAEAEPNNTMNSDAFTAVLAHEVRLLDLHDDYVPFVMASDTPLVPRLNSRILDWTEVPADTIVDLLRHEDGTRDFAVDVVLHFEDADDAPTLTLTLFGTYRGDSIEWSYADLSNGDIPADERSTMTDAIIPFVNAMRCVDLKAVADSDLDDMIEPDASIVVDVRRERIVTTGMEDLRAFICGASVIVGTDAGAITIPCIVHGRFEDGKPTITAVSLGL